MKHIQMETTTLKPGEVVRRGDFYVSKYGKAIKLAYRIGKPAFVCPDSHYVRPVRFSLGN